MMRAILGWHHFMRPSLVIHYNVFPAKDPVISFITTANTQLGSVLLRYYCIGIRIADVCQNPKQSPHKNFATSLQPGISWEVSSYAVLLSRLETALKDHHLDEAWGIFNDFKSLHGFPKQRLVQKLIVKLSYSSESRWLQKAHDLALSIVKERSDLLHFDFLTKLALSLARAQMPIPAATIVRVMLEKEKFPPMDMLSTVFLHMVKTSTGAYLASDILIEICEFFLHERGDRDKRNSKHLQLQIPSTMVFNLVLDACVRYGAIIKAQQIIEDLMPQTGVVADACSIVLIALIHERNGQRDMLNKLKEHIDGVTHSLHCHYQQFYDCLLSLHFKFNDIDAAASLILDLFRCRQSLHWRGGFMRREMELKKPFLVQIGSCNLRNGLKMQIRPDLLQHDFTFGVGSRPDFVLFRDGKLDASHKALAKVINGYVKDRRVDALSNLLISIEKELGFSSEASLSSDVMDACIQVGWLETAHDIVDDLESAAVPIRLTTYLSLAKAYCKGCQFDEAKVLLKRLKKKGFFLNLSDEKVISMCLSEDDTIDHHETRITPVRKVGLADFLLQEIREEKYMASRVYEINSSIYFFCKAKMMEDALKTIQKMQEMKLQPTVQTFNHLVNGYSSLKMYREITIVWGDIRRRIDDGVLAADRDLLEALLCNFIRGGYFGRVMEIVKYMKEHCMYTDKWKYKREFLKFHKDLYKNLKASRAKTEAQSERIEHVRVFRRWIGIH